MMRKTFDHAEIRALIMPYACHTTRTSWGISLVDRVNETLVKTEDIIPAIALSG